MSMVHTKPWPEIVQDLERLQSAYLPLVRFISDSDYSSELFGDVFLSGLLISDCPEFQWGVHMLRVEGSASGFVFKYTRGPGGDKDDATEQVSSADAVATLDLFLKVKYGVNAGLRKSAA